MKHLLFVWTGIFICLLSSYSQKPYTIAGLISDEDGLPLPGASVVISPGSMGVVSGTDGRYSISGVQPGDYLLVASFLGFEPHEDSLKVKGNLLLDIRMKASVQNLQEVVIPPCS